MLEVGSTSRRASGQEMDVGVAEEMKIDLCHHCAETNVSTYEARNVTTGSRSEGKVIERFWQIRDEIRDRVHALVDRGRWTPSH